MSDESIVNVCVGELSRTTVGLLGARIDGPIIDSRQVMEARLQEIERRILALEDRKGG